MEAEIVTHEFGPEFHADSRVLILGTIPSPKSREQGFYYGHPRNRFWKVLADVFEEEMPQTIPQKKVFLSRHHLALWDVLAQCEIQGAADTSIKNPVANDMNVILQHADIRKIYATGSKAAALYRKHCYPKTGIEAMMLPSTSPANCALSYENLKAAYQCLKEDVGE